MEPEIIGLIGTAVFIILVLIGVWIGFAALTVGIIGIAILKGWGTAGGVTGFLPYTVTASFAWWGHPCPVHYGKAVVWSPPRGVSHSYCFRVRWLWCLLWLKQRCRGRYG